MRTRLVVAIGLAVALALVVFAVVVNGAARNPDQPDPAAGAGPGEGAAASSVPGAPSAAPLEAGPDGTTLSLAPAAPSAASALPSLVPSLVPSQARSRAAEAKPSGGPGKPPASSPPTASESLLEVPQKAQRTPKALPTSVQRRPVFAGKPPKPAHARGKLAAGFPAGAVRLAPKAHVVSSSVAVQGKRVQVALEGRTKASVQQTVDYYAADIAAKGWLPATSTAADGVVTVRGGYGKDSIVVSVRRAPTGQTVFSAFGVFAAGG